MDCLGFGFDDDGVGDFVELFGTSAWQQVATQE